jgi:hypothetical protein
MVAVKNVAAWVYVLDCEHAVKIGSTTDLRIRGRQFRAHGQQRWEPIAVYPMESKARAFQIEADAHRALRLCKLRGEREWFHCHPLDATAAVDRAIRATYSRKSDVERLMQAFGMSVETWIAAGGTVEQLQPA